MLCLFKFLNIFTHKFPNIFCHFLQMSVTKAKNDQSKSK